MDSHTAIIFSQNFYEERLLNEVRLKYIQNIHGILTELLHNKNKGINLHAGIFSNFNTVLLQFYAQYKYILL